ncbi:MAG: response regulator [candidate division Zixibacteria bacterium]|jgi:DNA-binding NtrC family response regulator|nr:response regulator [candidate division Zixibacteria bacterium]
MARILVVDDELLIRDLLYDFFSSRDHQIVLAETARKALDTLKSEEVDLILTDLKMPDLDGMEFIRQARDLSEDTPVIIMTGFPSIDSVIEALRMKVSDYITKPFNINRLFETIQRVLEEKTVVAK